MFLNESISYHTTSEAYLKSKFIFIRMYQQHQDIHRAAGVFYIFSLPTFKLRKLDENTSWDGTTPQQQKYLPTTTDTNYLLILLYIQNETYLVFHPEKKLQRSITSGAVLVGKQTTSKMVGLRRARLTATLLLYSPKVWKQQMN